MSVKNLFRAGLWSFVVAAVSIGCGGGPAEDGSKATESEKHAGRNREMQDFMNKQADEASPAK